MIPILFEAEVTTFTTNGIGRLIDAKTCKVTEEENGEYELKLTYPLNGKYFNEIQNERLIVAIPFKNGDPQAFRIYSITDDLDGNIEVLANHISYDANFIPVSGFTATGIANTIANLNAHSLITNPFTITSDIVNTTSVYSCATPRSLRACLGGEKGSMLDVFSGSGSGQYEWNNFNIKLWKRRGSNKGFTIRYAKNLSEYDRERNSEEVITGCIAYFYDEENLTNPLITSWDDDNNTPIIYNSLHGVYPIDKVATVDASGDFDETPIIDELNTYAQTYAESANTLKETIDVEFYESNPDVNLCDTVTVKYAYVYKGSTVSVINYQTTIIKTVWNVLLDRYDSITVGNPRSTLGDTLNDKIVEASDAAVASVNHKLVTVVQHVDEELGQISQSVTELDQRVGYIDDDTGICHIINEQGSAIAQNAREIELKVNELEVEIVNNNGYNLSPFFGHPNTDLYSATDNPNGYWISFSKSYITEIGDGWAEVVCNNGSGSSSVWPRYYVAIGGHNLIANNYMALIEIKDVVKTGTGTLTVGFWTKGSDNTPQYHGGGESTSIAVSNGVFRKKLVKSDDYASADCLCRSGIEVGAGVNASFKIRISLYKDDYAGSYIPYISDHGNLNDSITSINTRVSQSSSDIQLLSDQISSNVTEISRVEHSIADVAQNEAATLIASSESKLSTQITQSSTAINATISSIQTTVDENSQSIDEMHTYFTFASDGLTVGKNTSDIRGVFGNSSLDFIDKQNDKLAWLSTSEGLGADMLAIGSTTDTSKRWKIITDSTGNYLRFTRHQ